MSQDCCKACGRPFVKDRVVVDVDARTAYFPDDKWVRLTRSETELVATLASYRISGPDWLELAIQLWPNESDNVDANVFRWRLRTKVAYVNKHKLRPIGWEIRADRGRENSEYRIVRVQQKREEQDAAVAEAIRKTNSQ